MRLCSMGICSRISARVQSIAPLFVGAIRLGAFVLLVRSVSFVFISTLRAFENYRSSVQITSLEQDLSNRHPRGRGPDGKGHRRDHGRFFGL